MYQLRRILAAAILLASVSLVIPEGMLQAQPACSTPRLSANMPGKVRAVSTAGNNLRAAAGLAAEITGQIANDTEFIVQSNASCVDGLNWYAILTLDGVVGWTAEGADGVYWLEPTAFCTAPQRLAHPQYFLDASSGAIFGNIVSAKYVPARQSLLVASKPEDVAHEAHPALMDYHWFNLETQAISAADYPDADIVTRELTDRLGITEYVFGNRSRAFNSLHVSPQGDHILYFVDNPPVEQCAHGCYTSQMWIADADGSTAKEIGTMVMGDAGYIDWHWASDGNIYLTMIYLDSSHGVIKICGDGSCFIRPAQSFPYHYAYPSVSPDGDYISFVNMDFGSVEAETRNILETTTGQWLDLPLTPWIAPAIWSEDGQTLYYTALVNDRIGLAATPLDDLSRADVLVAEFMVSNGPTWDIAPDLGMAFTASSFYGLYVYCIQENTP